MHTAPSSFLPSSHFPRNGTALPPPPVPTLYSRPQPQPQPSASHRQTESTSMSKKTGAKAATAAVAAATTTALPNNNQAQQRQSQSAMDEDIDGDGDGDDPNKRRRVARACDSCRKKKVRCDGIDPPHREACTNCSTYGHECKFLNAAKRRAPPRSYVDALEARMAKMEALVSLLAPGVDFTDKVGPPVVLPDIGDNADDPNAAAVVATTTVPPPTANSGFVPPTASIEAIHKSNFESNFGHSMPADLNQGEEEPENIGILLQHKIDRFDFEFHSSTSDSAMVDGIHRSNSSPDSETNGTSDGSAGSAEGTTPGGGGGSNGSRPPLSASDSAPKLTHRNDISIHSTGKLAEGHEHSNQLDHPDTAVFFGHSSNFMLYPQLEKLSLGMAQDTTPHRMRFMQDNRCMPIPDIYAETMGPPLESIELHWPEPDLQDALVDAYFESAHPNIPIVNEAIFRDELANQPELRKDRHFLNLCLGIFSIASRFVDDERLMTHPAANVHARWLLGIQWLEARKQLGFRMFPTTLSLTQLQGLILSSFFLQDTPVGGTMGWALLGVAIRLMQAHGVHRRAVNRTRQLPVHIDEQWKRCFWVCYNLDVELSSNMGRPIGVHEDDFDLEFPLEVDDDVLWEAGKAVLAARSQAQQQQQQQGSAGTGPSPSPTSASGPSASTSEPNTNTTSTSSPSTSTFPRASAVDPVAMQGNRPVKFMTSFNAMSKLNMIMARILRTIYMLPKARIARGYVGSQAPQFVVAEIDSALNEWINSIPRRIRFDPHEADDGLLLQSSYVAMRYYNSQILTHRPFISGTRQENPNFASLAICTNAARSCSHILDSLRKRGLLVNASMATVGHAFIAGCVLLMVVWSARKSGARLSSSTLSDVAKCVEALRAAEKSTYPATTLGAALEQMIIAAEIPFAAYSSQIVNHKRTLDDSMNEDVASATSQSAAAPPTTSTMPSTNLNGTSSSGGRNRRRPRSHGGRRSTNGSGASGVNGGVGPFAVGADAPPLPLSTQELSAPFHSTMSSASTPEQGVGGQGQGQAGTPTGRQQASGPGAGTEAGRTASFSNETTGNRMFFQQQQQNSFGGGGQMGSTDVELGRAMGLAGAQSPNGGLSSFSANGMGVGQAQAQGVGRSSSFNMGNGMYGSSASPSSSSASGPGVGSSSGMAAPTLTNMFGNGNGNGNGNGPNSANQRASGPVRPSLDFTSSSYDPMRVAAENNATDYPFLGNPASWTAAAFGENSFPAFADVSLAGGAGGMGGMNNFMAMGMGGMNMGMGMGMGMGFRSDQTGGSSGGGGGFDTLPGMMGSSAQQYPTHSSAASSSSTAEPSHQECAARMNNAANAINNSRSADGGSAEVINPETGETAPEQCLRMMEEHIVNSMNAHGPVGAGAGSAAAGKQQQQMGNVQTPLAGAGFPYDLGGHNGLAGGGGGGTQGATGNNGEPDPFAALFSAPFF